MPAYTDKDKIRLWMRLYNRLVDETYAVESWPDDDSSKPNIDALCRNSKGQTLTLEHTLMPMQNFSFRCLDPLRIIRD